MTPTAELALLEAAYQTWLQGGAVQSYTIAGRSTTNASAAWFTTRIDQLRAAVVRETDGGFQVAQFRDSE